MMTGDSCKGGKLVPCHSVFSGEIKRHCSNCNRQTFAKQPLPAKLTDMPVGQANVCLVFFPG